jgi:hypothetical protein
MTGHAQLHYLLEVLFGRVADMKNLSTTLAVPFVIAFLLSRAALYAWMNRTRWRPAGFSALAASMMSALILTAAFLCIYAIVIDYRYLASVRNLVFLIMLFVPVFLAITPMLVGASRFHRRTSPLLLYAAMCACLILQSLWFSYWTG